MEPTESVGEKGGTLTIDGLAFDFLDAGGTEAPSEFVFYIPAYKALHTTEVVTHNLHNILNLSGTQVRRAALVAGDSRDAAHMRRPGRGRAGVSPLAEGGHGRGFIQPEHSGGWAKR